VDQIQASGGSQGMAQLSDDCFAFGRALMRLADALSLLDQRLTCAVGEGGGPRLCRGPVMRSASTI
jgi:hypothetical protein